MGFSFQGPHIPALMQELFSSLPGDILVEGIYYDPTIKRIRFHSLDNDGLVERDTSTGLPRIQEQRKISDATSWISRSGLPYHDSSISGYQLHLDAEHEHTILALRLHNATDHLNDIILIHFRDQLSGLIPSKTGQVITPSHKNLIARLVQGYIEQAIERLRSDATGFDLVRKKAARIEDGFSQVRREKEILASNYKHMISGYCEHLISIYSNQYKTEIELEPEAMEKINDYTGPIENLETSLENAIRLAISMSENPSTISISPWDIVFNASKPQKQVAGRLERTMNFLDRYEEATRIAIGKGIPVTGKNIAALCEPAISAPAISDNLRKHRKRILELFNTYPEKWPLIREEFRPVRNLIWKQDNKKAS